MKKALAARLIYFVFALILLRPGVLFADERWITEHWMTPERFEAVCTELAANVDLFQKIWAVDPNAQLYGGTSRDFVWFVRGELSKATSRRDLEERLKALKSRPIQIQEFVSGQSDVDVVTTRSLSGIEFDKSYLTRIEPISPDWFDPKSRWFEQERLQGSVPVEKLRLGRHGFLRTPEIDHGNGIREIFYAHPTLKLDPRIVETELYKKHENHPLLLVLRYLRQVGVTYYRLNGKHHPDPRALLPYLDPESKAAVEHVIDDIRRHPEQLEPFLENPLFRNRLNKALRKTFRSYTNPTAAKTLFAMFGVDPLLIYYGSRIEPYHTLMYTKHFDPAEIQRNLEALDLKKSPAVTAAEHFHALGLKPEMYHGTGTMEAYRSIVFQGNIPSEAKRLAGAGVYAVDARSKEFAETWRGPGTLVVKLDIAPSATMVDISEGPGLEAFRRFKKARHHRDGDDFTAFADYIGADILKYDYGGTHAYVIKNGAAIKGQEGVTIPVLSLAQAREWVTKHPDQTAELYRVMDLDPSFWAHWRWVLGGLSEKKMRDVVIGALAADSAGGSMDEIKKVRYIQKLVLSDPYWDAHPEDLGRAIDTVLSKGYIEWNPYLDFIETVFSRPVGAKLRPQLSRFIDKVCVAPSVSPMELLIEAYFEKPHGAHDEAMARKLALTLLDSIRNGSYVPNAKALRFFIKHSGLSPLEAADAILYGIERREDGEQRRALIAEAEGFFFIDHPNTPKWINRMERFISHAEHQTILGRLAMRLEEAPWKKMAHLKARLAARMLLALSRMGQDHAHQETFRKYYIEHSGKPRHEAIGNVIMAAVKGRYLGLLGEIFDEVYASDTDPGYDGVLKAAIEAAYGDAWFVRKLIVDVFSKPYMTGKRELEWELCLEIEKVQAARDKRQHISNDWHVMSFYVNRHPDGPAKAVRSLVAVLDTDPYREPAVLERLVLVAERAKVANDPEVREALANSIRKIAYSRVDLSDVLREFAGLPSACVKPFRGLGHRRP